MSKRIKKYITEQKRVEKILLVGFIANLITGFYFCDPIPLTVSLFCSIGYILY